MHSDEEKEKEFEDIWSNIFEIDPWDNIQVDQRHEVMGNDYVNNSECLITPFEWSDTDRLNDESYLLRPVTNQDLKQIINKFKHKAPGKIGIIKLLLMKMPENAVSKFRDILNATILMGYFSFVLKKKKKKKK